MSRKARNGGPFFAQIVIGHPPELNLRISHRVREGRRFIPVLPALVYLAPVQRLPKDVKQRQLRPLGIPLPKLVQPEIVFDQLRPVQMLRGTSLCLFVDQPPIGIAFRRIQFLISRGKFRLLGGEVFQ